MSIDGIVVAQLLLIVRAGEEPIEEEAVAPLAEEAYPGAALAMTTRLGAPADGFAVGLLEATAPVSFASPEEAVSIARAAAARLVPSLPREAWSVVGPLGEPLASSEAFIPILTRSPHA